MPRKLHERAVRYANATRAIFNCPHCGLETSYTEREISADGVACRSCKRFFLPVVFYKDSLGCAACGRRGETVHYREGARIHRFCAECAALFDSLVASMESDYRRWLRGIVKRIRAARRLVAGCRKLGAAAAARTQRLRTGGWAPAGVGDGRADVGDREQAGSGNVLGRRRWPAVGGVGVGRFVG